MFRFTSRTLQKLGNERLWLWRRSHTTGDETQPRCQQVHKLSSWGVLRCNVVPSLCVGGLELKLPGTAENTSSPLFLLPRLQFSLAHFSPQRCGINVKNKCHHARAHRGDYRGDWISRAHTGPRRRGAVAFPGLSEHVWAVCRF